MNLVRIKLGIMKPAETGSVIFGKSFFFCFDSLLLSLLRLGELEIGHLVNPLFFYFTFGANSTGRRIWVEVKVGGMEGTNGMR